MALRRRNTTLLPVPQVVPTTGKFEGNDGKWSTHMINVGDGQNFRVLVSTSSTVTFLPFSVGGCGASDPLDCASRRGIEPYNSAKSLGYQPTSSNAISIGQVTVQLGQSQLSDIYGSSYSNISGSYYKDVVGLGPVSPTSLQLIEVIGALPTKKLFMGMFGLGTIPNNFANIAGQQLQTFLSLLPNITNSPIPAIPSLSYGYTAGASYHSGDYFASLVLGGYDAARFTLPKHYYPITPTFSVGVQSILITTSSNQFSATLDSQDNGLNFVASIDSTLPYLWLPRAVCDRFESIFGLTYDSKTDHYVVNDTMHQLNIENAAKIMFKFAETVTSPNASTITLPYAAFDLQASWPIYNNATNYFPIRRAPNGIHVLGRTFLQEAYLTVDYERNNFSVAQATFSAQGPASVIVPIYRPVFITQTPNKKSLSTSVIAGIGAAGGVVVLLLLLLAFFFYRRNKKAKALAKEKALQEEKAQSQTEMFPDLDSAIDDDERRRRGYSGSTALSSELENTDRRLSELPSPDTRLSAEYFGHKKTVSKETNVSELEVVHEIHELPTGMDVLPSRGPSQNLGSIREGVDEALGIVEEVATPATSVGISPMEGRSPGASPLVESPNEEILRAVSRQR